MKIGIRLILLLILLNTGFTKSIQEGCNSAAYHASSSDAYLFSSNWEEDRPSDICSDSPLFNKLVWSDEFEYEGALDTAKWYHQTTIPNGKGWFNNEIQHYTNRIENSYVESGHLFIAGKKENYEDQGVTKEYTSARLNSKFAFKNGRVEIRAKLPSTAGTWPAFWTLGKNVNEKGAYWQEQGYGTAGWPACGEIDIMEHWGERQNVVQSALHTPSSFGDTMNKGKRVVSNVSEAFHVYAVDWHDDKIVFSVDDVVHYTYAPKQRNRKTWPFKKEQYILLNLAILPSISKDFSEDVLEIDYVRVYQAS